MAQALLPVLFGLDFDFSLLCHPDRSTPFVSRVPFTGTAGIFLRAEFWRAGHGAEGPRQGVMSYPTRWGHLTTQLHVFGGDFCARWITFAIPTTSLRIR